MQRWEQWRQEIERTKLMSVPRCYSQFFASSPDIYANARGSAFAAVAYWRVSHSGRIDVSFVLARTRCAPLQIISIPRLELQAAVLATRPMGAHVDECGGRCHDGEATGLVSPGQSLDTGGRHGCGLARSSGHRARRPLRSLTTTET